MVPITIAFKGSLRCEATHGPSGCRIETDAPADNHGRAERFSPTDLVAVALGTCMMTVLGIHAERHGWNLDGMAADVVKEMGGPPRRISHLAVRLRMPRSLPVEDQNAIETIARSCPVALSIHPSIGLNIRIDWPPA